MGAELMRYALEVEFLNFGERGWFFRLFVEQNFAADGERADWRRIDSTKPRPADFSLCQAILDDIIDYEGIPEGEHKSLKTQLEAKFRAWAEKNRKELLPQHLTVRSEQPA